MATSGAQADWRVEFYRAPNGRVPVADFIASLPDRRQAAKVERSLDLLRDQGLRLGTEHVLKIKNTTGIFELRTRFQKHYYRVLFYNPGGRTLVLLHGFYKKTNQTPAGEIATAERYKAQDESRRKS